MASEMTLVRDREVHITVRSGAILGPILARVVGSLAARAELPLDRLSDALLVADAVAAAAPMLAIDDHLTIDACTSRGRLELVVGPLRAGGVDQLLSAPQVDGVAVLGRLSDTEQVVIDEREHLRLVLAP